MLPRLFAYTLRARRPARLRSPATPRSLATREGAPRRSPARSVSSSHAPDAARRFLEHRAALPKKISAAGKVRVSTQATLSERPRRPSDLPAERAVARFGAPPERALVAEQEALAFPATPICKRRRARSPHEKIIKKQSKTLVWITHLTSLVLFFAPVRLCLW